MNDYIKLLVAVGIAGALLFLGSLMGGGGAVAQSDGPSYGQSDYSTTITAPFIFEENVTLGNAAADVMRAVGTLRASSTLQSTGAVRFYSTLTTDATTTMSANLLITQLNTATSSLRVGCVQTVATSTATPINMTFWASSTLNIDGASVTSGFGGNAVQGLVLWSFGNCPRI